MGEDVPLLPIILGSLVLLYFGTEVERRRHKLRRVFNTFDKEESVVADALQRLVESGQLLPHGVAVNP